MKPTNTSEGTREKKRSFSHGSVESESSPKRTVNEKVKKPAPKITGDKDVFCWTCHRTGNLAVCSECPRAYHLKCGHLDKNPTPDKWTCPECDNVARAVRIMNSYPPVKPEMFAKMLGFVVDRVKLIDGSEHFCVPVDTNKWHDYRDYVIKPMDFPQLERNIEQHKYTCVEEFLADFRWMVHDSYVYNSVHSAFTKIAKSMFTIAKQECEEMKNCADCYLHAYTLDEETWFVEPCTVPHVVVWAQLSGFPYWPGKVMKSIGSDLLDVRFFGDHSRANVPLSSCFLYSRVMPCTFKKNSKHTKIEKGIEEAEDHVRKLKESFGTFYYALYRVPYVHKDEELIRKLQLPQYQGPNETPEFLAEVEAMRNDKMIVDKEFQTEMKQMLAQKKVQLPTKRKSSSDLNFKENPKRMLVHVNTPLGTKVAVMNLSGSDSDSSPKHAFNKKVVSSPKRQTAAFSGPKQNVSPKAAIDNKISFSSPVHKTKTVVDNNKKLSSGASPSKKSILNVLRLPESSETQIAKDVNLENSDIMKISEIPSSSKPILPPDTDSNPVLPHIANEPSAPNTEPESSSKAAESSLPESSNLPSNSVTSPLVEESPGLEDEVSLRSNSSFLDLLNGDISQIYDSLDPESDALVDGNSLIENLKSSMGKLNEGKSGKNNADSSIVSDGANSLESATSKSLVSSSACSLPTEKTDHLNDQELATSSSDALQTTSDLSNKSPSVDSGHSESKNETPHSVPEIKDSSNDVSGLDKSDCSKTAESSKKIGGGEFIQISSAISLSDSSKTPPCKKNVLPLAIQPGEKATTNKDKEQRDSGKIHETMEDHSDSKNRLGNLDVTNGMPIPLLLPKIEPIDEMEAEEPSPSTAQLTKMPTIKVVQTSSLLEKRPSKPEKRDCTSPKNNLIPPFVSKRNIKDVRNLIETKSQFISPKLKHAIFSMLDEVEVEYETYIDQITNVAERRLEHVEAAFETDKKKLFEDFKSQLRDEMDRQITAIKRKQWCANCGVEASFHCCWNYAYCGERCQKEDWATHNKICTQYNMSATDPYIKVSPRFQALLGKQNTSANPKKVLIQELIDYPVAVTVSSPNKQTTAKNKARMNSRPSIKAEFAPTISLPEEELPELPKPPPAVKSFLVAPVQRLNNGEQFKLPNGKSYPVKIMPSPSQPSRGNRYNLLPASSIRVEPNSNKSYYIVNDNKSLQPATSLSVTMPSTSNFAKNPKAPSPQTMASCSKSPPVNLRRSAPIRSYQPQQFRNPSASKFRAEPPFRIAPKVKVPSSVLPTKPSIRVIDETEIASILSGRTSL